VIGLPTNIKFLRRILKVDDFVNSDFDTSFIVKHEEELLKATRKSSHFRRGAIAIVKVFLETLKMRTKRRSHLDPWLQRDMFRMNHKALRKLELVDDETGEMVTMEVEYLKENTFNAYYRDENGFLVSILLNAQVEMNADRPDDLIVRTESELFKVDFYMDNLDNVTQLDYEGHPLKIVS
jgi:acetyl/propionyl-CoA carboxylase alpha subunit